MSTSFYRTSRHFATGGFAIAAFALFATVCVAAVPAAGARSQSAAAGKIAANTGAAATGSSSALPPHWPWRGVTMINNGPNGAQPADIDEFVNKLGINSVHLYMNLNILAKGEGLTNSQAWAQSLRWLDAMVAECKKDHIIAIVHLRSFPAPGGGYYNQHTAAFWHNPSAVNEIYQWTAALVKHLQSYGNDDLAYDILSEPTMQTDFGPEQPPGWNDIQKRIVEVIRANDPGRWVVVKPGPWGGMSGYRAFSPLPFPRLVYSVHVYAPVPYTHQGIRGYPVGTRYPGKIGRRYWDKQLLETALAPTINFQNRYGIPIWVGEFSAVRWAPGAGQYLRDLVSIFDSHGWGWSYFSVGGWNGWDPRYNTSYNVGGAGARADKVGTTSTRWHTLQALFGASGN